ncbi:hypothetical protein Tco_1193973 [Tanacetum coccineum]
MNDESKRCGDRNGRRSKDEELGNPFFEGDCSSSNEWGDYGTNMDFECQIRQLNQKHSEETALRVNQVASEILEHEKEIKELDKSHGDALSQVSQLKAELSQLENNLSVETKQEQLIITSNQEDLPSRLAQVLAQLEPFKKKLLKHQVNLDIANSRKERLSKKVTELQSKLKSGTLNLQTQRLKISQINRAELDEQCCLSLLESAKYCLEMAKESKENLLERQKVPRDYESGKLEDDFEKTYIKRSTTTTQHDSTCLEERLLFLIHLRKTVV